MPVRAALQRLVAEGALEGEQQRSVRVPAMTRERVDRVIDLGQTVAASFQTPVLIKIAQDLSEMRIDTAFAEADIGNIREGQSVRFTVDAFPNRNFTGEVQQIRLNPTNVQNVVTYNVRISFDNSDHTLLPGMTDKKTGRSNPAENVAELALEPLDGPEEEAVLVLNLEDR